MAVELPRNNFKHALAEGKPQIGLWLTMTSPVATEAAAHSGFDWLLIDMEHAANDLNDVVHHVRAAEGGTAEPIVRPPWNEPVITKRLLDIGVRSLLFPMVQTVDEARAAVAATRYPPDGIRGVSTNSRANRYGRIKDYHLHAANEICVLVQVETRKATAVAGEMAEVDGVDGVFIGPSDLSADFGHLGDFAHPDVRAEIFATGKRIKDAGKPAGFLSGVESLNLELLEAGFGFVAIGSDLGMMVERLDGAARTYRTALGKIRSSR